MFRRSNSGRKAGPNGESSPHDTSSHHQRTPSNGLDLTNGFFQTGRPRKPSLVNKSGFADRVLGAEETDTKIERIRGYLYKESRKGKMQKRFFVVNNNYLNYYRNRKAYRQQKVKGSVNLTQATTICILVRNGRPSRRFAIQTEADEDDEEMCLFLRAKSKQAARMWIENLNQRKAFWLGPKAPKELALPQITARGSTTSDGEDEEGWKDRVASDDEEDSDEGFQDARSQEYSDETESRMLLERQRRLGLPTASANDTYSSSSEDEEGSEDDESVAGGTRKSRSSSAFKIFSDALPEDSKLLTVPHHPWSSRFWCRPDTRDLMVRGPSYLTTKQKMAFTEEPLFECIAVDMFVTDAKIDHICSHPRNRVYQALQRKENLPFLFVIQFQVPGPPFYSMVVYLAAKDPEIAALLKPGEDGENVKLSERFPPGMKQLLLSFFKDGSDEFCNAHFKLIPRIVEGPWVVRNGIPSKPALIGNKLKNLYSRTDNYFELDINIGTSTFVTTVTQLAASYARLITVDLAFLVESKLVETLPEFIIGIVRCTHIDFKYAMPIT